MTIQQEQHYLETVLATQATPDGLPVDRAGVQVVSARLARMRAWVAACPLCGGTGRLSDDVPCPKGCP